MPKSRQSPHPFLPAFIGLACLILVGYATFRWMPYPTTEPSVDAPKGRPITTTIELQIALARQGFSPGSIDGSVGEQTRLALRAFQEAHQLPPSGEFDASTHAILEVFDPIYGKVILGPGDFARLDPPPMSWKERGTRPRMAYHSILEMVAEKSMSHPDLIRTLNPSLDFNALRPGTEIITPYMPPVRIAEKADQLRISLSRRTLQAIDSAGHVIFHSPVSIARRVDKRPQGELHVKVKVARPNYTFNPAILSTAAAREGITQKFIIQPGPNNPVGTVWIGLNLPSYGIHGTPAPEKVGRTESSGCFRLANWNAETLLEMVQVGTPVDVEP